MALVLGVVFNFIIDQINDVGKNVRVLGEFFLPVIAIIDVYVMIGILKVLADALKVEYVHPNIWLFGVIYVFSLSCPFFISHRKDLVKKYKKVFARALNVGGAGDAVKRNKTESGEGESIVPISSDYYELYLKQEQEKDAKKRLYEKKLKSQLIKRLKK